jgi:hypothetical protein
MRRTSSARSRRSARLARRQRYGTPWGLAPQSARASPPSCSVCGNCSATASGSFDLVRVRNVPAWTCVVRARSLATAMTARWVRSEMPLGGWPGWHPLPPPLRLPSG